MSSLRVDYEFVTRLKPMLPVVYKAIRFGLFDRVKGALTLAELAMIEAVTGPNSISKSLFGFH